jgi:hypothetical protein
MINHNTVGTKTINNEKDFGIDYIKLVAYLGKNDEINVSSWRNDVGFTACNMTREQAREFANKLLELTEHEYTQPEQIVLSGYAQAN